MSTSEHLLFQLCGQEYAIDILCVQEIRSLDASAITALSLTPDFMRGVMNLRGQIIPVIDLRIKLGGSAKNEAQDGPQTVVIVLKIGAKTIGAIADAVSDVQTINETDVSPVPTQAQTDGSYLSGLLTLNEQTVFLVDITRMIQSEDVSADGSISQERVSV